MTPHETKLHMCEVAWSIHARMEERRGQIVEDIYQELLQHRRECPECTDPTEHHDKAYDKYQEKFKKEEAKE